MANITKTLSETSGFIPEIWANKALDVLRANIVLAKLVSRDVDFDQRQVGDTLHIPYPGTFTAQDKTENSPATVQVPSGGSMVDVTLNKYKYVDFVIEDVARAQQSEELLGRWVDPAAIALAEQVETDLFALYSGLGTSIGTSGTDISAATIRTARKTLNDAKIPHPGRFMVVSDKDEIALLGDSGLATYFANSKTSAIAEGSIGRLYGFDVYQSQLVPVVTGTPNSTKNIAATPEYAIMAMRPFKSNASATGVQSSVMVDEKSGLAIRVQAQYSMADRGTRIGFDILYGVKILRSAAGVVVLA